MTEGTKALNSSVSTLKKNPGRIGQLVKAAKLLIVPPKQYATGKTRQALDAAVSKLKTKRGLNGVVGEGAGPFSDKAMNMEKKAVDKSTRDKALAATAVGSGAALGGVLTHDAKKSRITGRMGTKGAYKHMNDSSVAGAEKRLANSAKTLRRMGKPLKRAGIKGAIAGGLVGAALGAAHLKKEAAMPAVTPKQEFLGKGAIPAGAKDVSPKAVLSRKAVKVGKIAAGVAGVALLAGEAKKRLEKKAEEKKKSNVVGAAVGAGAVASTVRDAKDTGKALRGLGKQFKHMSSKGYTPSPIEAKMALNTFKKPISRRAMKAGAKGAVVGALAGAAYDKLKGHKKSAAAKIQDKGKTTRRGTVTSAAAGMGGLQGTLAAIASRKTPKKMAESVVRNAFHGASLGGTYGVARKGLRTVRGEKSMYPREFDKKKSLQKQAAEMIERNGQKYRKGTTTSAATKMAVGYGVAQALGNAAGKHIAIKRGVPIVTNTLGHKVPQYAAMGAGLGFLYGKVRAHRRNNRGEVSLSPAEFKKMKAS